VSQDLDNWELWFRLGECYDASGDRKLARKAIRKAIKLANSSKAL
jgi:cytochrome c-type biogenesis protein CcmH/NrfG